MIERSGGGSSGHGLSRPGGGGLTIGEGTGQSILDSFLLSLISLFNIFIAFEQ